jgi:hypothetical protein
VAVHHLRMGAATAGETTRRQLVRENARRLVRENARRLVREKSNTPRLTHDAQAAREGECDLLMTS